MAYMTPFSPIREIGVTELVGADEQVDQNEFGAAAEVTLPGTQPVSGEFLSFLLIASESGTGAVQNPTGYLLIFDADPGHSAGDDGSGITAAEWATLVGAVQVESSDWISEDLGAVAYITDTPVAFHNVESLFFVWYHTNGTSLNDAAGDDEKLELNAWYRRES